MRCGVIRCKCFVLPRKRLPRLEPKRSSTLWEDRSGSRPYTGTNFDTGGTFSPRDRRSDNKRSTYSPAALPPPFVALLLFPASLPIVGVSAVYLAREKQLALLLLVHLVIILAVTFTFAVAPSFRYLQPASVLTLLTVALCLRAFLKSRSPETPALSS